MLPDPLTIAILALTWFALAVELGLILGPVLQRLSPDDNRLGVDGYSHETKVTHD